MAAGLQSAANDERRVELQRELERTQQEAAQAWGRYHDLRRRKAVRAALALAELRQRVGARAARGGSGAAAPSPPQPAPEPAPVAPEPESPPVAGESPEPERPSSAEADDDVVRNAWEPGHYYSPVPDTRELAREPMRSRVWPAAPPENPGIDFRDAEQAALAREIAAQPPMTFPTAATGDPTEYHTDNEFFSRLDAWALQGILRHFRPRRMVEVGCGWSSLVTARVNREYLDGALDFTCIEPYPQPFLDDGIDGISRLIVSPVQEVPPEWFQRLEDGDVLFIDTSHVAKTGGDVPYLYHEVLPRLNPGVVVHIHDVFLPWDYPTDWVLVGRAWNEQYVLKSFLAFNDSFEVLLGIGWLHQFHPDVLREAIPEYPHATPDGGASFWMRRRP